jgi:hypothetical protein
MAALWNVGVHLLEWVVAFLTLDLFFRTIPLEPDGFRDRLRRYRYRFGLLGALFALGGALIQIGLAGGWGVVLGLLGWVPWWVLWRFGWRKQMTFLYKDDGGRDLSRMAKPDP